MPDNSNVARRDEQKVGGSGYNMDNWKITEHPPAEIVYPPFPHPDCWEFVGIPADKVRQIREAVDALLKSGGWISVEERLPEEGTHVLCLDELQFHIIGYYDADKGWLDFYVESMTPPTHWQPLPPLPQKEG